MPTKHVIDEELIGKKGYPRYYAALGIDPPIKEVVVSPGDGGSHPDLPPTIGDFSRAIDRHLDATAAERQYDSIQTAVTYRDDPNPQFAAEGEALFTWRSEVWTYATAELAKVEAGERPVPTVEAFIGELPAMAWPEGA